MSDIATKLEYLNGTKQALKESINNIGGEITSETTFREYAQELDNIYDNLPKTTGEDTNLSLTTLKGKMNIIPKGDTKQTQYSGYNELNIYAVHPKGYTETVNGVTIKYNDNGSVTANGTATADINYFLGSRASLGDMFNGTYYLSGCKTGSNTTYYLSMWVESTGIYAQTTTEVSTSKTSGKNWNIVIVVKSGASVNYTFYPMMSATSGKSFEPYTGGTASPNPTYPQDIEVVTGTQEVKVENVNLLNYSKFVKGRINSSTGQIEYASNTSNISTTENTISFTTTQAWNSGISSEFMPIDQGSYTYSIKSATLKASAYIDLYDKDQNFISRLGNKVINANEQTTWQVTISNTSAKYIRLHYEMGYADTITLTETQLEKRKHIYTIYTTPRTNTNSKSRRYRTM